MAWFKVDDGFHGHPKVIELSLETVGLWTLAGSWCAQYLTDGVVAASTLRRLGGTEEHADELVEAGLWIRSVDGWRFKDWEDYQPMKEDVEAERAAARARMKKVRARKKGVGSSSVRPNATRTDDERSGEVRVTPPDPPDPPDVPNGTSTAAAFDRAYSNWPKKVKKEQSRAKFTKLAEKHGADWLADQVIRFGRAYAQTTEKQFVPALIVWLNGERWTDELPVASREVVDAQWSEAMAEPRDLCADGHRWVRDGTCMHCPERRKT